MRGLLLAACLIGLAGSAQAVDPQLRSVSPPGAQAGSETELRFEGERLGDAQEFLFYQPGIEILKLEEVQDKFVRARLRVSPDCPLGEHHVRVRTAGGISDLRTFYVGPFPVAAKDSQRKAGDPPQKLPPNVTVTGSLEKETVGRYVVEARQGERLSAEVESMRLGRSFSDPYVSILDANQKTLTWADDTALFIQDCFASTLVPADGSYTIEIRETSYGALDLYRLHVGSFPRPVALYPPGGKASETLQVRLIDPAGSDFSQTVHLPPPSRRDFGIFAKVNGVLAPSWNKFRVAPFANVLESEPNDAPDKATTGTSPLPLAFNGIIEKEGDEDWFRFAAKKDETFEVQAYARSLRSPLDSVLVVGDAKGQAIASNDDSGGPDSYLRFRVPADGDYTVRLSDHLGKGGRDYTYRVEVSPVKPDLALYVPDSREYDTQTRKSIVVARGNRFPLVLKARRENLGGALALQADGLPEGLTVQADALAADKDTMVAVFEATPAAPLAGKVIPLTARLTDPKGGADIIGEIWQNYDLVQQGNQGVYYRTWVDKIAVAVVEELPFKIRIAEPQAPLVRDGTLPLKVVAERQQGFTEPIRVSMLVSPPGLGCSPDITIGKDQVSAIYPMSAANNAEMKEHRIALLGTATVKGGTAYVSTQLAKLQIAASFVEGKMPMATTIIGKPVQVKCDLTQKLAFPGKAKVELLGLPPGTATTPQEITADDKEVVFEVTTTADARQGLHRTLFCQLSVNYNAEALTQSFGGRGTLRIDAPPPPEPAEGDKTAKPEKAGKTGP